MNPLVIVVAASVLVLLIFRKYIGDILFETLVDGGLSFLDELLGIGLIPGGDLVSGDLVAAIMIFIRERKKAGKFAAYFGALEALNFIFLSFVPGADYITNIFPITPILRFISEWIAIEFPHSEWFSGKEKLAIKTKKRYEKIMGILSKHGQELSRYGIKIDYESCSVKEARRHMKKGNYSRAYKEYKQAVQKLKRLSEDEVIKILEIFKRKSRNYAEGFENYVVETLGPAKAGLLAECIEKDLGGVQEALDDYDMKRAVAFMRELGDMIHTLESMHGEYNENP